MIALKLCKKVSGLHVLGKDEKEISVLLAMPREQVQSILTGREADKREEDKSLQDISQLLTKIGENKLDDIIRRRAREVREYGKCLD